MRCTFAFQVVEAASLAFSRMHASLFIHGISLENVNIVLWEMTLSVQLIKCPQHRIQINDGEATPTSYIQHRLTLSDSSVIACVSRDHLAPRILSSSMALGSADSHASLVYCGIVNQVTLINLRHHFFPNLVRCKISNCLFLTVSNSGVCGPNKEPRLSLN